VPPPLAAYADGVISGLQLSRTITARATCRAELPLQHSMVSQADGKIADHIGGSARGYRGLPARLAIPTTAVQAGGQPYVHASRALGVNARF
jgi:hypothetical protein